MLAWTHAVVSITKTHRLFLLLDNLCSLCSSYDQVPSDSVGMSVFPETPARIVNSTTGFVAKVSSNRICMGVAFFYTIFVTSG